MKRGAPHLDHADVAIVGAGPAGLMAAVAAAGAGRRAVVLEQLEGPGRKLLASGGGRCNLTNTLAPDALAARFGRQGRFLRPALEAMDSQGLCAFLDSLGVATHAPDGVHVYPASEKAADVLGALRRRLKALSVAVRAQMRVTGLWLEGGALCGVETGGGRVAVQRVVLATGGKGYPGLGATGTGYALARQAGHTLVEPTPALVPLVTRETWPRHCAGVSLPLVRVRIDLPRQPRAGLLGAVLFTHTGLSGPAVLDLSGDVAALLAGRESVPLRIDLSPGTTRHEWLARFGRWQEGAAAKTVRSLLDRHLPRALVAAMLRLAGMDLDGRAAGLGRASQQRLADLLTALVLEVVATEGWGRAMVTRGGIPLKEVDPETLGSRRLPGLFFAGEILDLDGPSGGFNLQWAFSSGYLAGRAASQPRD